MENTNTEKLSSSLFRATIRHFGNHLPERYSDARALLNRHGSSPEILKLKTAKDIANRLIALDAKE